MDKQNIYLQKKNDNPVFPEYDYNKEKNMSTHDHNFGIWIRDFSKLLE